MAYKDKDSQRAFQRNWARKNYLRRRDKLLERGRLYRLAHPILRKRITFSERFFRHVRIDRLTGCWQWIGKRNGGGYGRFKVNGKHVRAHVVCWEMFRGNWPANGEQSDHECCNPSCVNPYHQEPVTRRENIVRQCERKGWKLKA